MDNLSKGIKQVKKEKKEKNKETKELKEGKITDRAATIKMFKKCIKV